MSTKKFKSKFFQSGKQNEVEGQSGFTDSGTPVSAPRRTLTTTKQTAQPTVDLLTALKAAPSPTRPTYGGDTLMGKTLTAQRQQNQLRQQVAGQLYQETQPSLLERSKTALQSGAAPSVKTSDSPAFKTLTTKTRSSKTVQADLDKINTQLIRASEGMRDQATAEESAEEYTALQDKRAELLREMDSSKQVEKQLREDTLGKPDALKLAGGTALLGANQFVGGVTSTLSAAEGLLTKPLGYLTGDDELYKTGMLYKINEGVQKDLEHNQAYMDPEYEKAGLAGDILKKFGPATVAAIPQAMLAFVTAGQSLAAQTTTAGLQAASAAAQGSGLVQTTVNAVQSMARSPQFWASFATTAGQDYEQARQDGAGELAAYTYATVTSLVNALVEIGGGGIDELPDGTKSALRNWIETMLDEGKEEVVQGMVSQLMQNVAYGKENPMYSVSDPNAIINPTRMIEEYIGGVVVGGVLGGGQNVVSSAQRFVYDTNTGKQVQMSQAQYDLVQQALQYDPSTQTAQLAAKIASGLDASQDAKVSNADIGKLVRLMRTEAAQATGQSGEQPSAATQAATEQAIQDAVAETTGKTAAKVLNPLAQVYLDAQVSPTRADAAAEVAQRVLAGDTTLSTSQLEALVLQDETMRTAFETATGAALPAIKNRSEAVKAARALAQSQADALAEAQTAAEQLAQQAQAMAEQAERQARESQAANEQVAAQTMEQAVAEAEAETEAAQVAQPEQTAQTPAAETAVTGAPATAETTSAPAQAGTIRTAQGGQLTGAQFEARYVAAHPEATAADVAAAYRDAQLANQMGMDYPAAWGAATDGQTEQTAQPKQPGRKSRRSSVAANADAAVQTAQTATQTQERGRTAQVATQTAQEATAETRTGTDTPTAQTAQDGAQKAASEAQRWTVRNANYVLSRRKGAPTVELSFDMADAENGHYDERANKVVLNGNTLTSQRAIVYTLAHELTHAADAADGGELVGHILSFAESQLGAEGLERATDETLDTYVGFYMSQGMSQTEAEALCTPEFIRQELAADLMRDIFLDTGGLYQLARQNPTLLNRARGMAEEMAQRLQGRANTRTEAGTAAQAQYNELTRLVDKMDRALRQGPKSDIIENTRYSVEADRLYEQLNAADPEDFSAPTVQELSAYHQIPEVQEAQREKTNLTHLRAGRGAIRQTAYNTLMEMGSWDGSDYRGEIRRERHADLVIGLPGSGKSSTVVNPRSQEYGARVIDSDMAKELLPEYDKGKGANNVHEESSMIRDAMLNEAKRNGENLVWATVGGNLASLKRDIAALKAAGYTVELHLVDVTPKQALARALRRYVKADGTLGRYTPAVAVLDASVDPYNNPKHNYEELQKEDGADGFRYYDNRGTAGIGQIAQGEGRDTGDAGSAGGVSADGGRGLRAGVEPGLPPQTDDRDVEEGAGNDRAGRRGYDGEVAPQGDFEGGISQEELRRIAGKKAFQAWFHDGNGELRDPETGLPKLFYHGTKTAGFTRFERQRGSDPGFWFADHPHVSDSTYYTGRDPADPDQTREFEPRVLTSWDEVDGYLRENYPALQVTMDPDYDEHGIAEVTDTGTGDILGGYPLTEEGLAQFSRRLQDLAESAEPQLNAGLYQVFLSMEKPLVVHCQGADWNKLRRYMAEDPEIYQAVVEAAEVRMQEEAHAKLGAAAGSLDALTSKFMPKADRLHNLKTRDFIVAAEKFGYDGVIFLGVRDGRLESIPGEPIIPVQLQQQVNDILGAHNNFGAPDELVALDMIDIYGAPAGLTTDEAAVINEYLNLPGTGGATKEIPGNDYVVMSPEQVKSVYNVGTFDQSDPDIRYSVSSKQPFKAQVNTALREDLAENRHNALYIRTTPQALTGVGLGELPLCLTARHVQNIVHAEDPTGEHPQWHGVPIGVVKRLPELLAKPVMLLESATRAGDLVVVTEAVVGRDRPVVVSIHPNGTAVVDGTTTQANFVTSVYGRENFWSWVRRNAEAGNVLFWDEKKSRHLPVSARVQFPGDIRDIGSTGAQTALPKALTELAPDIILRQLGPDVKGETQRAEGGERYSVDPKFAERVRSWDDAGQPEWARFVLGSTGAVLQGLGAIESDIYMDGDKISTILSNHPEMTLGEIQRIPEILEDPVLILKSKNVRRNPAGNTRLVMFGSLRAKDGRPIMCVLDLRPTEGGFLLDDMQRVTSAYTKDTRPVEFIQQSEVMHADKKRTVPLLRSIGFDMPMALLRSGSMGSISYHGTNVNLSGEDFSSVVVSTTEPQRRHSVRDPSQEENVNPETGYARGSLEDSFMRILNTGDRQAALDMLEQAARSLNEAEAELNARRRQEVMNRVANPKLKDDALALNRKTIDRLIERYGAMEQTSAAQQEVRLPKQVSNERKVAGFVQTAAAARVTTEEVRGELERAILDGEAGATYVPVADQQTLEKVRREIETKGFEEMLKAWRAVVDADSKVGKLEIARAEQLYVEACNQGDVVRAQQLVAEIAAVGTQAGQTVQAMTLLKQMTPAGKLYYIQKAVDRLNKQQHSIRHQDILIDPRLAQALLDARNQEELDAAMENLIQDLANQVPVTLWDKWDAWRYLSMLGNPRTHIRNVFGNAVFVPVRLAKDALAQVAELALPQEQRTKGWGFTNPEMLAFARQDAAEMESTLRGGGKYNPADLIRDKRVIFKTLTPLNALSKGNNAALEAEDWWFLRAAYTHALSGFLNARGADVNTLSGEGSTREGRALLNQARSYAIREAQRATYRDASKLAQALNNTKRNTGPVLKVLLDGLVPFTKTPINIVKRGVEYSPIGILKGAFDGLAKVRTGEMTAAEAIDELCAGLTGLGVIAVGVWLASMGLLTGGLGDDDEDQFKKLQGQQEYALNIGGINYTIDWMAPVALPLFVGAELYSALGSGEDGLGLGFDEILDGLMTTLEPMLSLSMLDGVNQTLSSVRYGDQENAIYSLLSTVALSYLTQGVPTVLGQVARTLDDSRRTTFTQKGMGTVERALSQTWQSSVQGKTPVYAEGRMLYLDNWGRADTEGSVLLRAFENMISPGYLGKQNTTAADAELTRLAEATGDTGVYPGRAAKYFSAGGETYAMTQEEYQAHLIDRGQTSYQLVNDIISDPIYEDMNDEERAAAVEMAYEYAADMAKWHTTETYEPDNWMTGLAELVEQGGDAGEYLLMRAQAKAQDAKVTDIAYAQDSVDVNMLTQLVYMEVSTFSSSFTDPYTTGYEYQLDDAQQDKFREFYKELLEDGMYDLVRTDEYRRANAETRAELVSALKKEVNAETKAQMSDWLFAQNIYSTPKS